MKTEGFKVDLQIPENIKLDNPTDLTTNDSIIQRQEPQTENLKENTEEIDDLDRFQTDNEPTNDKHSE